VLGQTVRILVNSEINAGEHEVVFDATDLPSGIYFYQLKSEFFSQIRKAVFLP
jgi:hypothetical protein